MILIGPIINKTSGAAVAGAGLCSKSLGDKSLIYRSPGSALFMGAWYCDAHLLQKGDKKMVEATFKVGFVNALEPKILSDDKLISEGIMKEEWKPKTTATATSSREEMWVVVEVQIVDETGKMKAQTQEQVTTDNLRIKLSDTPYGASNKGEFGFSPLALLIWKDNAFTVHQIAYFSLRHNTTRRTLLGLPVGSWRHFFHAG